MSDSADGSEQRHRPPGQRIELDPDSVQRGLVGLVLSVVELLRQLMERQALRRIDVGDLSDEQIEKLGSTLMALEEHMTELREHFGLTPDDLNIDLGPLGSLLSSE
jgi:hypothetical protein